ncbi:oxidoreductase [Rubrobacter taiwanensis]|jgi:multicomponent Na+:H+ antiporter subunit D|uniref:Oxidoreductase n=1 Tax=Rubrobacter taiwanensis TaxID=185139 RepID=A0A4R1BQ85_9ACTN|nr:proton-conducting transporter membrane subunit [Rubrobacter taiwanensis]TCJ19741.1 oxidoreductase [Rubrobacter taiwanensis]
MIVFTLGLTWTLAVLLSLLDGRKHPVGGIALGGLAAGFAGLLVLGWEVFTNGPVTMVAGGWPPGVGITLRADALGVTFAVLSVGVILIALAYEAVSGIESRTFPALAMFMAAGLTGLFLTGDAFNFYVFFEIAMIAAYALTGYGERARQLRAAFIFAVVNLLGSVLFLIGVGALYHLTGTLDMRMIAERVAAAQPNAALLTAVAIFVAFSLKLGLFPFHYWLPAVYTGVRPSVAAMLSGALANIGSYGLLRFGGELLPQELEMGATALFVLGTTSIIYGALQAVSRRTMTEVLAYSAIGQVGYILIALGIGGPVGFAAAVVYAIINSLNKLLLFLAAGLRGWMVGAAFAVGAFSVAGVPPAAGFLGKLVLFQASLAVESVALVALIFIGGALSFVYSFQIYQRVFWKPQARAYKISPSTARLLVAGVAGLLLFAGAWPEPLLALGQRAAAAVLLGGAP